MRRQSQLIDEVLVTRFIEPPDDAPTPEQPDTLFVVSNGLNGLEWDAVQRAKILAKLTGNLVCTMLRPGTGDTVTDKSTLRELRGMSTYDLTNCMADTLCYRLSNIDSSVSSIAFIDASAPAKQAVDFAVMASLPISGLCLFDPPDRLNLNPMSGVSRVLPKKLRQDIATARGIISWREYKKRELRLAPRPATSMPYEEPEPVRPPFYKILSTEVMLYGHRWSTGGTSFHLGSLATEAKIPTLLVLPLNTSNGTPEDVRSEADNLNDLHQGIHKEDKQPFVAETVEHWHNMLDTSESYKTFARDALRWLSKARKS